MDKKREAWSILRTASKKKNIHEFDYTYCPTIDGCFCHRFAACSDLPACFHYKIKYYNYHNIGTLYLLYVLPNAQKISILIDTLMLLTILLR